jgi:glyoxylase-like metal-dependent hydrolase (beta-lactamase superfamily II)
MKIAEGIFQVPEVVANVYLIVDPDGLTIIDTGVPNNEGRILDFIASLGHSKNDLKRIILTHADRDHIGSLSRVHQATGARTYASQKEAQAMAAGRPSRPLKLQLTLWQRITRALTRPGPFKVHEILTEGQELPVAGGLRVVDSAGHTPGHISLFAPSRGVLFCGDSMVTDGGSIQGSRPMFTWDQELAGKAVRRQAELGARILCSGHGPVVLDAAGKFPV